MISFSDTSSCDTWSIGPGTKISTSVGLVDWAITHNIILFVLPVHTSHFLQPLDVDCYGPFHRIFNNECHKEMKLVVTHG
jgi:hypothetical protein